MERRIIMTTAMDAAQKLGIDSTTMYRRLEARKVAAVKDGDRWQVFLVELVLSQGATPKYVSLPYSALKDILGAETASAFTEGE